MKLLLDENPPHKLRTEIVGHEVFTVENLGQKNGEVGAGGVSEVWRALTG
jgi:hypothetical protein